MSTVIKIENLSKYYRLGLIGGGTLQEDVSRWWASLRGKPDPLLKIGMEDHGNRKGGQIWALRDINLEVKEGEILGIIGGNGAGKSTLLKLLSRITAPTEGRVKIKGRVGSLLEVGTGFHPELTGRENVYLNGTILGMSRQEVTSKLDEIIEFSEMSRFIDTPVKRYSSGMTVRLGFSVAVHLEPEILIVDEVLAVGDVAFQKKCLDKMKDISRKGRTILFVSHNMNSIARLCSRSVILERGVIVGDGDTDRVIKEYLSEQFSMNSEWRMLPTEKNMSAIVKSIQLEYTDGSPANMIEYGKAWQIRIRFEVCSNLEYFVIGLGMLGDDGVAVRTVWSDPRDMMPGTYEAVFREDVLLLTPRRYRFAVGLSEHHENISYVEDALSIEVCRSDDSNPGDIYRVTDGHGYIANPMVISMQPVSD